MEMEQILYISIQITPQWIIDYLNYYKDSIYLLADLVRANQVSYSDKYNLHFVKRVKKSKSYLHKIIIQWKICFISHSLH